MVKKYITKLKNGAKEKQVSLLGRFEILKDGEIVSESVVTKTFPSLFEEIGKNPVKAKPKQETKVTKEPVVQEAELLIDDSSAVSVVEETPEEPVSKVNNRRNAKSSNLK